MSNSLIENERILAQLETRYASVTPISVAEKAKEVSELEERKLELDKRLSKLLRSSPAAMGKLKEDLNLVEGMVNAWTDNICILRQFLCSKLGVAENVVNESFGIPEDLDVID